MSSLFSLNLVGLFDPLSLLYRTLAIVFYPAFGYGVEKAGLTLYRLGPPLTYVSEPIYQFFKATVLPFRPLVYLLPVFTLVLFALVVAAERVDRRFWCRAFCPLGALYGLIARFSRLRRRPTALCPDCGDCTEVCKMAAFAPGKPARHLTSEGQLCLRCLEACDKEDRVSFTWTSKAPRAPLDLGRRQVITAVAAGVVAVPLTRLGSLARRPDEFLVRPPGAQTEAEVLSRCIRCGQCMKVCLTNGIQPVLWEAGLEGLYTPRLIPRLGYCAYSCNLCGQVCPTGAIPTDRFLLRAERCLTYHNELPADVPFSPTLDPAWHNCLIGCMVCQLACPANKEVRNRYGKGESFTEEETALMLRGVSVDQVPRLTADKLQRLGLLEDVGLLARNLKVLIGQRSS